MATLCSLIARNILLHFTTKLSAHILRTVEVNIEKSMHNILYNLTILYLYI